MLQPVQGHEGRVVRREHVRPSVESPNQFCAGRPPSPGVEGREMQFTSLRSDNVPPEDNCFRNVATTALQASLGGGRVVPRRSSSYDWGKKVTIFFVSTSPSRRARRSQARSSDDRGEGEHLRPLPDPAQGAKSHATPRSVASAPRLQDLNIFEVLSRTTKSFIKAFRFE